MPTTAPIYRHTNTDAYAHPIALNTEKLKAPGTYLVSNSDKQKCFIPWNHIIDWYPSGAIVILFSERVSLEKDRIVPIRWS